LKFGHFSENGVLGFLLPPSLLNQIHVQDNKEVFAEYGRRKDKLIKQAIKRSG
jgi:hypothetical protein